MTPRRFSTVKPFQKGMALLELLVGMAIGLMVILAALGAMIVTQQTSSTVGDRSRLQQRADDIMRNMGFHIQQAGAPTLMASPAGKTVSFSKPYPGIEVSRTSGNPGLHVFGTDGAGGTSDSLVVGYQDDSDAGVDNARDCLGNSVAISERGLRMDNTFRVTSTFALECVGSGGTRDVIGEGVEEMQIRYAIKTGTWASRQTRWFDASDVSASSRWPQVQAVEVCLQLRGERTDNVRPTTDQLGCNGQAMAKDGRLRLLSRKTFVLRNVALERE